MIVSCRGVNALGQNPHKNLRIAKVIVLIERQNPELDVQVLEG